MVDSLTLTGAWFLPGVENNYIMGTLTFNQNDGIHLELLGSFNDFSMNLDKYDVIYGIASGKHVTLVNCYPTGGQVSFPGISTSKYTAIYMLTGSNTLNPEQEIYNNIQIQYHNMDKWIGVGAIKSQEHFEGNSNINLTISVPESIELVDQPDIKINLHFGYSLSGHSSLSRQIQSYMYFELIRSEGFTFHD